MAEPTDLVLENLKVMQGHLSDLRADVRDLKARTSATEQFQGHLMAIPGTINQRVDRFDERLGRIERRLELSEA